MRFLTKRPKRAAVFGCGPAGLFAAYALENAGINVEVFSIRRRSEMFGAQYLHAPIPGVSSLSSERLRYVLRGTTRGYAEKVYGPGASDATVSPSILEPDQKAWDIRQAYYALWEGWQDRIIHHQLDAATISAIVAGHDISVSSIPAPMLCTRRNLDHSFASQRVWAIGDAPERGTFAPNFGVPPMTVICSGESDTGWYRASNVFGYRTVEWPEHHKPPIPGISEVTKPIATNCDCFPQVMRVGRYGVWQKGILSHTAYTNVWERYS